ncbi:MAG: hypothetical protein H7Y00_03985 [Fimbriimonadaceae bacterium]|nr:hypothetical protein [Chitinophagales bacterium]
MLRYLKYKEIDKPKWDDCIDHSVNALPYAYSWYLDITAKKNWNAIIIDNYKAVFPVPVKNFIAFKKVYQPFFTQQLGLFVTDKIYFNKLDDCIALLKKKYRSIYLHLNVQNIIPEQGKRITHHLRLNNSYDTIYHNYSSVVKKNLKSFQHKVVSIVEELPISIFIEFVKKYVGNKAQELKHKDFILLQHLIETSIEKEKGFIRCAKNMEGEVLSAAFILKSNNYLIYLVAASSPEGRKNQTMTLLIDSVIKEYANANYILDFEGSMIPGIANFYKTFSATEISFPVINK